MSESFNAALATIPANLFGLDLEDPLKLSVGDLTNKETVAEEQGVATSTFGALQAGLVVKLRLSPICCLSYFILLVLRQWAP